MKNISVIGAGTMGNGIAHVFAQNGFKVSLIDVSDTGLKKALETISQNLDRQIKKGLLTEEQKNNTLSNIQTTGNLPNGVQYADLAIEAVTENPSIKLQIFKDLDLHTSAHCLLASNTSSISISTIAAATSRPDKVIGMHFMNPVPVMKLVEVIKGKETSESTTLSILALSEKIGKIPVAVNDSPGFIANRILIPMINEAIYALHEGVAGVQEIDAVMKLGMAHPMGPLQLADLIGLDICLYILKVLHDGFNDPKYTPCPLLFSMVEAGQKGIKSGEGFYNYHSESKELIVADRFLNSFQS